MPRTTAGIKDVAGRQVSVPDTKLYSTPLDQLIADDIFYLRMAYRNRDQLATKYGFSIFLWADKDYCFPSNRLCVIDIDAFRNIKPFYHLFKEGYDNPYPIATYMSKNQFLMEMMFEESLVNTLLSHPNYTVKNHMFEPNTWLRWEAPYIVNLKAEMHWEDIEFPDDSDDDYIFARRQLQRAKNIVIKAASSKENLVQSSYLTKPIPKTKRIYRPRDLKQGIRGNPGSSGPLIPGETVAMVLPIYGFKDLTTGEPGELWIPGSASLDEFHNWQVSYRQVSDPYEIRNITWRLNAYTKIGKK